MVNQQIIASQSALRSGVDMVNGTIHSAVQTDVKNTGSNLEIQASIMASLKGVFSFKLWFIWSNNIIQFLTTIQNNATIQIIQGKDNDVLNIVSQ